MVDLVNKILSNILNRFIHNHLVQKKCPFLLSEWAFLFAFMDLQDGINEFPF